MPGRRSGLGKIASAPRILLGLLVFCLFFPDVAQAQIKEILQPVGVIQYNVKNHQGGWISDAPSAILKLQVQLIAYQVRNRAKQHPPVDFIALEQSELNGKNGDGETVDGDISALLKNEGLSGWTMIQSKCEYDVTQLAYSPDWELVTGSNLQNPLVDSTARGAPQNGWVPRGCFKDEADDGRPYNIAYFNNRNTSVKVLFVITHMPHCRPHVTAQDYENCIKSWNVPQFKADIRRVVGKVADLGQIHLVMAGDMNEFGGSDEGKTFDPIFSDFGALQISTKLKTCCDNDGFGNSFDRLLANSPARPTAEILTHITQSKEISYPLDPGFSARTNEEHKAIFGVVEFASPAPKP